VLLLLLEVLVEVLTLSESLLVSEALLDTGFVPQLASINVLANVSTNKVFFHVSFSLRMKRYHVNNRPLKNQATDFLILFNLLNILELFLKEKQRAESDHDVW